MISILIITRGRPGLLQKCLDSLIQLGELVQQVVVVLNGEDTATREVLLARAAHDTRLEWFEIAACAPGAARNAGVSRLRHDWTLLIDDDAELTPGYQEQWQLIPWTDDALDAVGGRDAPPPDSQGLARAVGIALSSFLCTGPTSARHASFEGNGLLAANEKSMTSCHLWIRTHWLRECPFPEDYQRGEETVFLQALLELGAHLWRARHLVVWHARRDQWWPLARASFLGGYHRGRYLSERRGPDPIFTLPGIFVLMHLLLPLPWLGMALMLWWFFPVAAWSWRLCQKDRSPQLWPLVVALHWLIPFTYGLGFLSWSVRRRPWK